MARLNDTAAAIDQVELLRRKYSRQNKEIARINSTQCIRIRNLENEVSRLLAENLDLREQILRVQSETESKSAQQIAEHVNTIKLNIEAKLLDLGGLVTSLGCVVPTKDRTSVKTAKSLRPSPTQSPDQKNWKNIYTLSEAVGQQEGRLPPILEDKSYPRRTLESTEIIDLLSEAAADNTDSPDIGPPPVSQFINEDPVKIDLPTKLDINKEEDPEIDPTRSVHLEQRKKRRDSTAPSEQKRPSRFEPGPTHPGKEVAQSLKTGAKRKLSIRDEEDGVGNTKPAEISLEDFKYARGAMENQPHIKTSGLSEKQIGKTPREFAVVKGTHREKTSSAISLNTRRALGPKTVNTDVTNSPKKNLKQAASDNITSENGEMPKKDHTKERVRERKAEFLRIKPSVEPSIGTTTTEPEPETPAAPDLFSPPGTGSSAVRAESRDTPPPPDLGPGIEGQRPSRRARGSVSYAEPNLRDKMRRPTKELVDAVAGEGKAQRLSLVKLENDAPTTTRKIKEEQEADGAWKTMPSASLVDDYSKSPLVDKVNSREPMPGSLITQRQRRRLSTHQDSEGEPQRSGSGSAISALLGATRKLRQESNERSEIKGSLDKAMAKLDIYEFTGSSPREASDSRMPAVRGDWHVSRTSGKPSSIAEDPTPANSVESSDGQQATRAPISSSRRRQSILGLGSSVSTAESEDRKQSDELRRSGSQSLLSEDLEGSCKNERVSTRRRSMML